MWHDRPAVDDLFWVLVGEKTGCVVPSETVGMDQLMKRLQDLPGFDSEAAISAMSCTTEREFLCWEKHSASVG